VILIGLLRFVGLLNAAVWFGAAFFFVFFAEPATTGSEAIKNLLGPASYPYFSVAISQIVASRFFALFLVCAVLAMLHMFAEWLYFGKSPQRLWLILVLALFLGGLLQNYAIQPKLKSLLLLQYARNSLPELREPAARSYRVWHIVYNGLNVILVGSLAIYLWRVANPSNEMRFVGASNISRKFHS